MVGYDALRTDLRTLIGKVEIAKQSQAHRDTGYLSVSVESNVAVQLQSNLRHIGGLRLETLSQSEREHARDLRETYLHVLETDQLRPSELYFLWRRLYGSHNLSLNLTLSSAPVSNLRHLPLS